MTPKSNTITITPEVFNPWWPDFYKAKNRYLLSYGGSGSGKSRGTAQKFVRRIIQEKGHRFLIIRKVANTIRNSVFEEFKTVVRQWRLLDDFRFNKSELSITHIPTGNVILTMGVDDPEKLKSISGITSIWIEEATELTEEEFNQIDLRLRGQTVSYKQIILTFNPIDENHWIVTRFFGENASQYDMRIFKTTFVDNKFIDDDYKRTLTNLALSDENAYRIYYNGEWGILKVENPFFTNFDQAKHTSKEVQFQPTKRLLISIDFNINPFAVIFSHMWRDEKGQEHLHIFDEASIEAGSIPAMVNLIKERYSKYLHACWITGDAMGNRRDISQADNASYYRQLLKGLGLNHQINLKVPSNPAHTNSRSDCNYLLYHYPDFKINPINCPNVVRDMKLIRCDAEGSIIKKDRKKIEQQADFADTVRYLINSFAMPWIERHRG